MTYITEPVLENVGTTGVGVYKDTVDGTASLFRLEPGLLCTIEENVGSTTIVIGFNADGVTAGTIGLGKVENIANNFSASSPPSLTNDLSECYSAGSRWIDTINEKQYFCFDGATGGASWKNLEYYDAIVDVNGLGDYPTISGAFSAGAVSVFVKNGVYLETDNVYLPQDAVLIGENSSDVIINFGGGAYSFGVTTIGNYEESGTVSINTGTSNISGTGTFFTNLAVGDYITICSETYKISSIFTDTSMTIETAFRGDSQTNINYTAQSMVGNVRVSNLTVTGSSEYGLDVLSSLNSIFEDVKVVGCGNNVRFVRSNNTLLRECGSSRATGKGLILEHCQSFAVDSCGVRNNVGDGIEVKSSQIINIAGTKSDLNGGNGIVINSSTKVLLNESMCKGNVGKGIEVDPTSSYVVIESCVSQNNGGVGVDADGIGNLMGNCIVVGNASCGVWAGDDAIITQNQINSNNGCGIRMEGDVHCVVDGNRIQNNTDTGIWINSDRNTISNNFISGNSKGVHIYASDHNIVSSNNIFNHTLDGIHIESSGVTASGPTGGDNSSSDSSDSSVGYTGQAENVDKCIGNVIVGNSIRVATTGIFIDRRSDQNVINSNSISGTTDGIDLGGDYCAVVGNRSCDNVKGIIVRPYSKDCKISANVFCHNSMNDIIGVTEETKGTIELSFTENKAPYTEVYGSNDGVYAAGALFIFCGSGSMGIPKTCHVIANNHRDTPGKQSQLRVYDSTNGAVICESAPFGGDSFQLIDLGAISNVPAGMAVFELQAKGVGYDTNPWISALKMTF